MGLAANINQPDETPLHSSGYAEIANAGGIGAVSPETFTQRRSLNDQRQIVGRYSMSHLGSGYTPQETATQGRVTPRRLQKTERKNDTLGYQNQQRQAMNSRLAVPPRPSTSFREPPARNYNPYA